MINTIYIEKAVRNHERTNKILKRFPDARRISCDRYGEVFNPRRQNFRIQKQNPALIIAEKLSKLVNYQIVVINGKRNIAFEKKLKEILIKYQDL